LLLNHVLNFVLAVGKYEHLEVLKQFKSSIFKQKWNSFIKRPLGKEVMNLHSGHNFIMLRLSFVLEEEPCNI